MSQINFEDDTLDASDGVTKLLLAAEYWKAKAVALRAELDALRAWKERTEKQEPVGEVVLFGGALKEIVWRKGELPVAGVKLYARPIPPAPSVPDGWKLVPIEPTEEMINKVIDERLAAAIGETFD
jgi:hypothetical protein